MYKCMGLPCVQSIRNEECVGVREKSVFLLWVERGSCSLEKKLSSLGLSHLTGWWYMHVWRLIIKQDDSPVGFCDRGIY